MNSPSVDQPSGLVDPRDQPHDPEDEVVLPWWQNPLNFIALGLASLILGVGIGYFVGHRNASPNHNDVDIGFLQDMRYHHEQAVDMAWFYVTSGDETHPRLRLFAEEIVFGQQLENGRMVQMLRDFGAAEANDTGTGMQWMGMPIPIERMPGLATDQQLDEFASADGEEASRIFAALMIEHHRAGIEMAEYAVLNGENEDVASFARSMITGQSAEIDAMRAVLAELG